MILLWDVVWALGPIKGDIVQAFCIHLFIWRGVVSKIYDRKHQLVVIFQEHARATIGVEVLCLV